MAVPEKMAALLAEIDENLLPGVLASDRECEGAQFHSPQPLVVNDVLLVPESWGIDDDTTIPLCGTCEANLAILCVLLKEHDGELDWPVRREFGNMIRALGLAAWDRYLEATESEAS